MPVAYQLEVEVDPDEDSFRARNSITIDIVRPAAALWLHGRNLVIERAVLRRGDQSIELSRLPAPPGRELLGFGFATNLAPGRARVDITYRGSMGKQTGLFRQTQDGLWYAYTDFEPLDARAAMPCFDDPRFKTPWKLSLIVPAPLLALANTPMSRSRQLEDGRKRVEFATTRPLPAYLVAFAVGPFEVVDVAGTAVPVRIVTPRGKATWAEHAAAITPSLLALIADYFTTPIPFAKIDFIAVPSFDGAMENPGLITYAQHILLAPPGRPGIAHRRLTAMVIAHELAHLWLGDLVTMRDWEDLWLNEGAATWFADATVARWDAARSGELDWELERVTAKLQAMSVDSHLDVRAVRQPITSDADVAAAFDAITYKKGGAVLTMVDRFVGEHFQSAINSYVSENVDGTTTTVDLTAKLSQAAGRDLGPMVASFVDQSGLPLVTVETYCTEERAEVTLTQSRYLPLAAANAATADDRARSWRIPICMRYGTAIGERRTCTVLTGASATVALADCPRWLYPNADELGYFRFAMPEHELLAAAAAPLSAAEQLGLASNVDAMLRSGDLELDQALAILTALAPRATSRPATLAIVATLTYINRALIGDNERRRFAKLILKLYARRAGRLGFAAQPGEDEDETLVRPVLVELIARHLCSPKSRARTLTDWWLTHGRGIEKGMLRAVVTAAATCGDDALHARLSQALEDAGNDPSRRRALLAGLGSFTQPDLVAASLAEVASSPVERDFPTLIEQLVSDPRTSAAGFAALSDPNRKPSVANHLRRTYFAAYALRYACSEASWSELSDLVEASLSSRKRFARHLAAMRAEASECIAFRARHEASAARLFN